MFREEGIGICHLFSATDCKGRSSTKSNKQAKYFGFHAIKLKLYLNKIWILLDFT